ncbi:hypothetical protein GENT5_14300 [Flavobacterium ammoniigenes]|mgnify:CR=1 FL=1|uniref:Uncharacterized protein n=1 Tax=Flavobacterium ammoniigenes TaxID=1751095 RepID=A0ABN6L0D7_9FLAO|nr:hypothetical protein [Flavobacterium ammoniigenes]BDB55125.1 hypothetical protein GENT5_14300 [Flavobacterium ammoniigenes]
MIHAEDILIMDKNFNLENTIIENDVLKRNNRALEIILVVVVVTVMGVLIANSIAKRLEEESKQRV